MKQVILDTNFIIACVKQKIDFLEEIPFLGLQVLIPEQVIGELKNVQEKAKKLKNREEAMIAINLLNSNKGSYKKIDLKSGHVDKKIIAYARTYPDVIVGTLDGEIKKAVKNNKLVIRSKKKLEII